MSSKLWRNSRLCLLVGVAVAAGVGQASAGEKWTFGPEASFSIGMGIRASAYYDEDALDEENYMLESARIFTNGQFTKMIGFTFNTEIAVDQFGDINQIRMMDAIARFEFSELFNVWGGRMLAPSDRANLDGPYYIGTWEYPLIASRYPQIFQGRDNGVAVFGQTGGGKFKYAAGAYAGCTEKDNACYNPDADSPLLAGRLTYNFWDPESGYYTSSDYFGEKELLSVALVGQYQADAAFNGSAMGDFSGVSVDVLMQKKVLGGHVLTLEGAYYIFDTDGIAAVNGLSDGTSYMFLTSFLIDHKVGIGKFQPVFRYQGFDNDLGPDAEEWSVGTNYIIKGHDLRLSAVYSETDVDGADTIDRFIAGLQFQY